MCCITVKSAKIHKSRFVGFKFMKFMENHAVFSALRGCVNIY